LEHTYRGPNFLLEVKRRGAHVKQCSDRLAGVLLHISKSTGLCREIEFRDLDDPPTGFPLDDEACAWTRRNNAFRSSGSAEQLAGWSLIVVGDRFVRSRSELSPRALTVLSVGSSRAPRPWSA